MTNWTDFIKTPAKAAKRLHVSQRDVDLGAALDEQRVRELLRRQMQGETSAPHTAALSPQEIAALRLYEQRRRAEPPRAQGALDILRQQLPRFFQENQQLADATGDLSLKEGALGTAGAVLGTALPVAIGSGLTGAATGAGMSIAGDALIDEAARKILGESIQDPLSSGTFGALAGGTGKIIKPLVAALGASSSEAAGMPFHSWMKRLNSLNKVEPTAMYVNPTNAELLGMMRDARETYPTSPTVRLLRDQRSNDVYGVEGSSILHDDMRKHLKLKYEFSPGSQGSTLPELDTELHFLKSLPRLAGGGAIKRLGKRAMSAFDELRPSSVAPQGALSVVKNKGGNWLTGSVEDALSGLKGQPFTELDLIAAQQGQLGPIASARVLRDSALNSWIDSQLTKYVKNRMATPEDEVRRLAEQGVLHSMDLPDVRPNHIEILKNIREKAGFPRESNSRWEDVADFYAWPTPASSVRAGWFKDPTEARRVTEASKDWLEKLPPDQPVYGYSGSMSGLSNDLGFNHLIDELSNALNPASGLPRNLQLTPEAVKNMSMEKAVRLVSDINAHRAAQKVEANRKLAEQASVIREYAENNPKGLRWVELKAGETPNPEMEIKRIQGKNGEYWTVGLPGEQYPHTTFTETEAIRASNRQTLADQLKYEGDTMGHCVGGYCDDVLSGRTRIFSLRDAKGEPHVTVEVGTKSVHEQDPLAVEAQRQFGDAWEDYVDPAIATKFKDASSPRIIQIKGKQNRKPNDEYLPFVQDFVRNNPLGGVWGDVGDLHNTGLRRVSDAFNANELKKLKEAGIETPLWADKAQIEELHKQFNLLTTGTEFNPARAWERMQYDSHIDDLDINLPDRAAPFAHGGVVTKQLNPADNFQGIIAAIEEALA